MSLWRRSKGQGIPEPVLSQTEVIADTGVSPDDMIIPPVRPSKPTSPSINTVPTSVVPARIDVVMQPAAIVIDNKPKKDK